MSGFSLRQSTDSDNVEEWTISSLTLSPGDLLEMDVGATAATVADSSTEHWQRKGVCIESATSSDTKVQVMVVNPSQVWEVESANNSDSSDNGDRMVLSDKNTVNNTGSDSTAEEACVVQLSPVGANSDKRIRVRFLGGPGVDPDAA